MKISYMTNDLFYRECGKLLSDIHGWAQRLKLIQPDFALIPKQVADITAKGQQTFPFPFAAELKRLWDYARFEGPKPLNMDKSIETLLALLWQPVLGVTYKIPFTFWKSTTWGYVIKRCYARDRYESGEDMTIEDIALLTGYSSVWILRAVQNGKIKAIERTRKTTSQMEYAIPNSEAKNFIEKVGRK